MNIVKTTLKSLASLRNEYFQSLPEFQELFIELMMPDSDCFFLQQEEKIMGYTIRNRDGILIEFYVTANSIPDSHEFFVQVLSDLSITGIYCKSFDALLLSNCMLRSLPYSIMGILFRDYATVKVNMGLELKMEKANLSAMGLLLRQDDSIKELFETADQLTDFIENEHVFLFINNEELLGCGIVIRTNTAWDYCDLGVWVNPSTRGVGVGSQIIVRLRAYAIENNLKPSCGCAIDNIASRKAIEKSGFVSRYNLIEFIIT
jgi:predicted acetyltransferase